MQQSKTTKGNVMSAFCLNACPVCKHARKQQKGFSFRFVKNVEGGVCPACKAYAKAYGRKPHEPIG
jgi:hypothetical protein